MGLGSSREPAVRLKTCNAGLTEAMHSQGKRLVKNTQFIRGIAKFRRDELSLTLRSKTIDDWIHDIGLHANWADKPRMFRHWFSALQQFLRANGLPSSSAAKADMLTRAQANLPEARRALSAFFTTEIRALRQLSKDDRRKLFVDIDGSLRGVYDDTTRLLGSLGASREAVEQSLRTHFSTLATGICSVAKHGARSFRQ